MRLEVLLDSMPHRVVSISKDQSVVAAINKMVQEKTGALLVTEGDGPWGIFTQRDLLAWLHRNPEKSLSDIQIEDVISGELITAAVNDPIDTTAAMMLKAGISHLPVIKEVRVVAVVTLSDLMVFQNETLIAELHGLESYIDDLKTAEWD